jgi:hypothetical protein
MAKLMGSFLQISLGKCAQNKAMEKGREGDDETEWNMFTNVLKTFIYFENYEELELTGACCPK